MSHFLLRNGDWFPNRYPDKWIIRTSEATLYLFVHTIICHTCIFGLLECYLCILYMSCSKGRYGKQGITLSSIKLVDPYQHAGYSDTWDTGGTPRTGERRVNWYLIDYQKWRNWTQQTAEWGHCCRGLVLVAFKHAVTVSSLRSLLCSISSLLIDNQISVHSSLTHSWCSTRIPSVGIPGVIQVKKN